MAEQKYTAQQRAQLFAMSTRQNMQMLPTETVTGGAKTVQFTLPKARLLSSILVRVNATVNIKSVASAVPPEDIFTPFKIIRRISLDLNNGFSPYTISGEGAAAYNMIDIHPDILTHDKNNTGAYTYVPGLKASTSGIDNTFSFTLSLPVTTNPRDAVGMILLQSNENLTTLSVDLANGGDILDNAEGYTVDIKNVKITPMVESFSIPANQNAIPDLTVLKLVNERFDSLPSSGQQIVKLSTGTIYRKILFILEDENGNPMADSDISAPFQLVFNQADTNYSIDAEVLRVYNQKMLGYSLPKGMYVFDFSNSGSFPNLGGTRDFISSENLTEFWLRFNTTKKGKIRVITECLSRLV